MRKDWSWSEEERKKIEGKYRKFKGRKTKTSWKKDFHPNPSMEFKKGNIPVHKGKTKREFPNLSKGGNKNQLAGNQSPFWKGGITSLYVKIRELPKNTQWRNVIFRRDKYTCQNCGNSKSGNLQAHHKNKRFNQLLQEFLQKYSQFSPIEDKETLLRLAITYEPFWDLSNGQTLCIKCHELCRIYD